MTTHRRELERAAASHTYLRGLFGLPLGAALLLAALANADVGPLRHDWLFPLAVAAIGGACLPIRRFYDERYGHLTPSARDQTRAGAAVVAAVVVMLGVSSLLRSEASWSLDLPVNAIAVAFALVMLVSYAAGAGLRTHHVAIAGALLLAGALPVWTGEDPGNAGLVLAAVAVMASGLLDHRAFVRRFGPPDALRHDA
jgi:hypothetical protein